MEQEVRISDEMTKYKQELDDIRYGEIDRRIKDLEERLSRVETLSAKNQIEVESLAEEKRLESMLSISGDSANLNDLKRNLEDIERKVVS